MGQDDFGENKTHSLRQNFRKDFQKKVTRLGGLKSEKQIGLSSLEIREIILELTEGGTQLVLKK